MSVSSDPSMTDTKTLLESMNRDMRECARNLGPEADKINTLQAHNWLREAHNTLCELIRRQAKFDWK